MPEKATIVIPALNEDATLGEIVRGLSDRYPSYPVIAADQVAAIRQERR